MGVEPDTIRRMVQRGDLARAPVPTSEARKGRGRGRPPRYLVVADEVEAQRQTLLQRLDAVDRQDSQGRELVSTADLSAVRELAARLEAAQHDNGRLRAEVAKLREVVRISLRDAEDRQRAQAEYIASVGRSEERRREQLEQFIVPDSLND